MSIVADVVRVLEQIAPLDLAAAWDNVGLLLGDAASPVRRIMTCLTVTPESADEAVAAGADLIVTHHPIFFRPAKRLITTTPEGRMVLSLARAGVAVYSPHTAWDNATSGINDLLAAAIGLTGVKPLRREGAAGQYKIVVFVPDKDLQKVSDALFAAGAGHIGEYRECGFRLAGTGTFFGSDAANPTIGEKGRREEVSEWRLEVICPERSVDAAIAAMRAAHSYEEPAYDVYALRPQTKGGAGRIGELPQPATLAALAETVKMRLAAASIQITGDPARMVRRVAIVCGSGGDLLGDAAAQQADVFLTGEARFHDALAAQSQGMALVLTGHYASERFAMVHLADRLKSLLPDLEIWPSRNETDPLRAM